MDTHKKKVSKTKVAAVSALTLSLLAVGGAPAFAATTTSFKSLSLNASINGSVVTASTKIQSGKTIKVQSYGICVRDASGKNYDFNAKYNAYVSNKGTSFSASKVFPAGTYSYYPCVQQNNTWWWTSAKTFTIKPATNTPTPTPTPISTAMPVGDQPGWKQNYTQDFNTPAPTGQVGNVYGDPMSGYDGFNDTSGHGTYAPKKVLSVSNGSLNYNLHSENGRPLVAAPTMNNYKGQTYGKYSVRFRSDSLPGYKIAFLLWPSSDNWNEGEIDWPEGNLDTGKMRPASAVPGSLTSNWTMTFEPGQESFAPTTASDWHVATTEWTPNGVKWYWDGQLVASTTKAVPKTDFRWTLQAETEINGKVPASSTAGNLQVDWVTSYSYNPSTATTTK
jgi:hypothetical protein